MTGFDVLDRRVRSVEVETGPIEAEAVVLAAGAWTPSLTRLLGVAPPGPGGEGPQLLDHAFGILPSQAPVPRRGSVGVHAARRPPPGGGTVEVGPIDRTIDQKRWRRCSGPRTGTGRDAPTEIFEAWAGPGPLSPDGLPVIGRVPKQANVFVATGHAMLGMTMAPITGRAVARMVLEGEDAAGDPALHPTGSSRHP